MSHYTIVDAYAALNRHLARMNLFEICFGCNGKFRFVQKFLFTVEINTAGGYFFAEPCMLIMEFAGVLYITNCISKFI